MAVFPPPLFELERRLGIPEGSLDGSERARAEDAIHDACTLVRAELPLTRLAQWIGTDAVPDIVPTIAIRAARREFENPQGYVSTSAGDASARLGIVTGAFLTDDEIRQLRRASLRGSNFVGSPRTPSGYGL